jgi:hypothetical protein
LPPERLESNQELALFEHICVQNAQKFVHHEEHEEREDIIKLLRNSLFVAFVLFVRFVVKSLSCSSLSGIGMRTK